MSVLTTEITTKWITFGNVSAAQNLTNKTLSAWAYLNASTKGIAIGAFGSGVNEQYGLGIKASNKPLFFQTWSSGVGVWSANSAISSGTWHHICVSYNSSSTSQNPVIYVDGASVAITEDSTPAGTLDTGTTSPLNVCGDETGVNYSYNGYTADCRIYSAILTAGQVLALYNDGPFSPNYDTNLVFHALLNDCSAKSGAAFDGLTLTSSQKFYDRIGCAEGTPSGSPVGSDTNPT